MNYFHPLYTSFFMVTRCPKSCYSSKGRFLLIAEITGKFAANTFCYHHYSKYSLLGWKVSANLPNYSTLPPKTSVTSAVANRQTKHLTDLQIHNGPTMHSFRSWCSKPLSLLGMYYEWVAKHVGWKSLDIAKYIIAAITHAIYRLQFFSNSLIHILSLSNSHNNIASIQKNRDDKSHRVIVAILSLTECTCWARMTQFRL